MIAAYSAFANLGMRAHAERDRARRERAGRGPLGADADARAGAVARRSVAHGRHDEGRRAARHGGGQRRAAGFHVPAGGKTGTTNDGTDVWFIGYTADLVAGVWMGFDKPQKIKANAQGGVLAAPAWTAFMTRGLPPQAGAARLAAPRGHRRAADRSRHRSALGARLRPAITEYFIAGTEPIATCIPPRRRIRRRHAGAPTTSPVDTSFGFPAPTTSSAARPTRAASRIRASGGHRRHAGRRARAARVAPAPRATPPALRSARRPRRPAPPRDTTQPVHAPPVAAQMTWQPVDCHAHSTHSDGALSVADVVERAPRAAACGRASPTTSRATRRRASTRRDAVARYLDDLERYDVLRGGEFCWHDTLWRELPPDDRAPLHAPRRLAARHSPRRRRRCVRVFHRELPERPHAGRVHGGARLVARGARGEMPVDILAHPTLSRRRCVSLDPHELWTRGARGASRARAARRGDRVRDLQPLPAARAHRPPRRRARRAPLARLRRPLARPGRRRRASARARARRWACATRTCTIPRVTARRTRRLRRMTRYHARWVVPVRRRRSRDGTLVEREGRIAYVGRATTRRARAGRRRRRPRRRDPAAGPRERALPPRAHRDARLPRRPRVPRWILRLTSARRAGARRADALLDAARLGVEEGVRAGVTTFADTGDSGRRIRRACSSRACAGSATRRCSAPTRRSASAPSPSLRDEGRRAARARDAARARRRLAARAVHRLRSRSFAPTAALARELAAADGGAHRRERARDASSSRRARARSPTGCAQRGIAVAPRARSPIALLERARRARPSRPLLIHCVRVDDDDIARDRRASMRGRALSRLEREARPRHRAARRAARGGRRRRARLRLGGEQQPHGPARRGAAGTPVRHARAREPHDALSAARRAGAGDARRRARAAARTATSARSRWARRPTSPRSRSASLGRGPTHDPVAAAVLALAGTPASFVAVAGRPLVRDGRLLDADPSLARRVQESADRLQAWLATPEGARATSTPHPTAGR